MKLHRIIIRCTKYNVLPYYEDFYFNNNKDFLAIIKDLNKMDMIERNIKVNKKLLKEEKDYYSLYRALYNIDDKEEVKLSVKEIKEIFKKDNYYA